MQLELGEKIGTITGKKYKVIYLKGIHDNHIYLQMPCDMYEELDDPEAVLEEIVDTFESY
ncbi:MAG: hypothetical protein QQN41_13535 [Nitrosopumilus sp.]